MAGREKSRMDHSVLYEILYALAALGERKQALFGNCAPAARKAFARSCAGNAFPEIWFEIPLLGEPRFDLHALTSRETLDPEAAFPAEVSGGLLFLLLFSYIILLISFLFLVLIFHIFLFF